MSSIFASGQTAPELHKLARFFTLHSDIFQFKYFTMSETWFQSYARTAVLAALRRIQHGRIVVISKYRDGGEREVLGEPEENGESSREVSIVFKNPNAWVRICQGFDVVCRLSRNGR